MEFPYKPPLRPENESHRKVDDFLASLSGPDLLYARRQLNHCSTLWDGFSKLEDLPTEIVLMILNYLALEDLFTCLRVNVVWETLWGSHAVVRGACQIFFEGLVELAPEGADLEEMFYRAGLERLRRHTQPAQHTFLPWGDRHSVGDFGAPPQSISGIGLVTGSRQPFYHDGVLVWKPQQDFLTIDKLRVPGKRVKCQCTTRKRSASSESLSPESDASESDASESDHPRSLSSPEARRREHLRLTESAVLGHKSEMLGVSRDLMASYIRTIPADRPREHRLHLRNTRTNEEKSLSLPGPITKGWVNRDAVIVLLESNTILSYVWGGILRNVPVELKHFPEDDDAVNKPQLDLSSPGYLWVRRHKPVRLGPSIMYHPRDRNVFYLAWRYRRTSKYAAISSIEIVKYVDNKPVQHFFKNNLGDLTLLQAGSFKEPSCEGFDNHITHVQFGCEPINEFGLFTVFLQGVLYGGHITGVAEPRCPSMVDSTDVYDQWQAICFNVCTEAFSENHYQPISALQYDPGSITSGQGILDFGENNVRAWGDELWVCGTIWPSTVREDYVRRYIEVGSSDPLPCQPDFEGLAEGWRQSDPQKAIRRHDIFLDDDSNPITRIFADANLLIIHSKDGIFVFHWDEGDDWTERPLWPWEEEEVGS